MLARPHAVYVSPYDPDKHVWIVDDFRHAIFKFTNDGKRLVQTIGTYDEPGADATHFFRPTFMAWLPDGTFFVADGYENTRVVKFDASGKYLMAWGEKGTPPNDTRPGYLNNVHGIAVDPRTRRVFVNDRANNRAQVFDENGKFLDQWSFGGPPSDIHLFLIDGDGYLWAADRGTNKILKYVARRHAAVLVGHVGHVRRRHVGRARHERRQRRQLLHGRGRHGPRAEIPAAARRESALSRQPALGHGALRASSFAARRRTTYQPEIDQNGNDDNDQLKTLDRAATVDRPRVRQRRQRHEQEPEKWPDHGLIRRADVVAEDNDEHDGEPGRHQRQTTDHEWHEARVYSSDAVRGNLPPIAARARPRRRRTIARPLASLGYAGLRSPSYTRGATMARERVSILKGAMDLLILKALSWGPMHGYGVSHWIRQVTEDTFDIQEGVLYPALHRLEEKGWIEAEWGVSENNRQAKYYALAPLGRKQLRQELSTWARFAEAVGKIVQATEKPAWVQS